MNLVKFKSPKSPFSYLCIILGFVAFGGCGGGGGGDGDSVPGATRDTAVRVLHGAIDMTPIGVYVGGVLLAEGGFLEPNEFGRLLPGEQQLSLTRSSRSAEVFKTINILAEDKVEYSIFAYGSHREGTFNTKLLSEPVLRPSSGMGRIRFLNGVDSAGTLTFNLVGTTAESLSLGQVSEFVEVPVGEYQLLVSRGGSQLVQQTISIGDREEQSILAAGKLDYDFIGVEVFSDLD